MNLENKYIDNLLRMAFAPDPTDVSVYHKANRNQSMLTEPELRMWKSVFETAVVDLLKPIRRRHHLEALAWLNHGREDAGSFVWVCEALGVSPSAARSGILRRLEASGGSDAVMPTREPKNSIAKQPLSHHRGRRPRKAIVCQQPLEATAGECSSGPMAAQSAAENISSAEPASSAETITPPTAVNQ